jgi:hypothetical protein
VGKPSRNTTFTEPRRIDGKLHIYEATSRFNDRDRFAHELVDLGFSVVTVEDAWKFTHIYALKTDRAPTPEVKLKF